MIQVPCILICDCCKCLAPAVLVQQEPFGRYAPQVPEFTMTAGVPEYPVVPQQSVADAPGWRFRGPRTICPQCDREGKE